MTTSAGRGTSGHAMQRIGVIWRFELAQTLRPGALLWSAALALLPVILLRVLISLAPAAFEAPGVIDLGMYLLIPNLVCLLGLLLTATSAIHSEIENRTWTYLAVRPGARRAALFGKYLFAVTWVTAIALTATLAVSVGLPGTVSPGTALRTAGLAILATFGYGALYLTIGVVFLRIGMVVAIVYTLVMEVIVGNLPALVNLATFSHHLRSLFVRGLPADVPIDLGEIFSTGDRTVLFHIGTMTAFALILLTLAASIVHRRESSTGKAD